MIVKSLMVFFVAATMIAAESPSTEQVAIVRGTIVDESGAPIAGATIQINRYEGQRLDPKQLSTKSDREGYFELSIPVSKAGQLVLKDLGGACRLPSCVANWPLRA